MASEHRSWEEKRAPRASGFPDREPHLRRESRTPAHRRGRALLGALAAVLALAGCAGTSNRRPVREADDASMGEPISGQAWARSVAEAREQAQLARQEPYWPLRAGELYLQADSLSQAEEAFREALARNPGYEPALCQLSRLEYAQGRHAEAIDLLVPAVLREGRTPAETSAELVAGFALHLEAHGEFQRAEELLAIARQLPVRGENTSTAIAYLALRVNEPTAATVTRAAYEADSTHAVNANNYGIVLLRGGEVERARRTFLRALELRPDLPAALYNLAILERFYLLDNEAGRQWYERYRALATEDPDGLAEVFGASGSLAPASGGK